VDGALRVRARRRSASEADLALHRRIAEASHNDLLAYIGSMLALALPRHKAILAVLLARDPLAAHQTTLVQLDETREDLSSLLAARQGAVS